MELTTVEHYWVYQLGEPEPVPLPLWPELEENPAADLCDAILAIYPDGSADERQDRDGLLLDAELKFQDSDDPWVGFWCTRPLHTGRHYAEGLEGMRAAWPGPDAPTVEELRSEGARL